MSNNTSTTIESELLDAHPNADERKDFWQAIRQQEFPITSHTTYLKNAATGPALPQVLKATSRYYQELMDSGDLMWEEWATRRDAARAQLARLINAEPDEIAFTANTSAGMNLIADATEDRGDVIASRLEFPVSTVPFLYRGKRIEFIEDESATFSERVLSESSAFDAEDIARRMTERTGVISVSHVQYSNGLRSQLETIGSIKKDHIFVVNASQSAGVLPIDVKRMKIDALCATGHKWLCAGLGTGFVYLSRELLERTRPRAIGWMSVKEPFEMRNDRIDLRNDAAARAELGVPVLASIFALGASVARLNKIGIERIEERALEVNRYLTARLLEAGHVVLSPLADERQRSAETLVAFNDPARIVAQLAERKIQVTEKPEGIRVATHLFNNEDDIESLVAALSEIRDAG